MKVLQLTVGAPVEVGHVNTQDTDVLGGVSRQDCVRVQQAGNAALNVPVIVTCTTCIEFN